MQTERELALAFLQAHPKDAAAVIERFIAEEAAALLVQMPTEVAASVIEHMTPTAGTDCLMAIGTETAAALLGALHLDDAAALLRGAEPALRQSLLDAAPAETSGPLITLLSYPPGTAGGLMDPRVLSLPHDIDVGEALARVRRSPQRTLYYVYVVDRERRLVGVLNLRELMLAPEDQPLAITMNAQVAALRASATRDAIVAHPGWRDYHALPVVDDRGALVGAIRYETLRRLERSLERRGDTAVGTAVTLAELYWVGLAGMMKEAAAMRKDRGG
jgi:magnesium transporter